MISDTTICAVATSGSGALAIIRVSGPEAIATTEKIFQPATAEKKLSDQPGNTIHFGTIRSGQEIVDEVLVSLFKAPVSYTGEDLTEISCHASPYIQQRIMELLTINGAVPAKAGEFTQRAFLNGKMDLSQAEAVADLIASESKAAHDIALQQIRGGFSMKIKKLRKQLLNFISLIELELDFSEEDVEFADRNQLSNLVSEVKELVDSLKDSFQLGNVLKKGVPVAIIGRPNVGKSTLLNVLLDEERAIVSEIEGTTRDTVEDTVAIDGITFRFIDTAGIRETADTIENLGIRRTYQKIDQAAIVLLLVEAKDEKSIVEKSLQEIRKQLNGKSKRLILVINKADNKANDNVGDPAKYTEADEKWCRISAKTGHNVEKLKAMLLEEIKTGSLKHQDVVISNIRHYNALSAASGALNRVLDGLETSLPQDLLAQDIRETLHFLGEITGEVTTDEILGNIFKNFCIGK